MHWSTYTKVKTANPLKPSEEVAPPTVTPSHMLNWSSAFNRPHVLSCRLPVHFPSIFNTLAAMHPVGPNEALAPRTEADRCLLKRLKDQLTHNVNISNNAHEEFKSSIFNLIETFKEACVELEAAQSELLNEAYEKGSPTCDILGPLKQYEISDGSTFMAPIGDMFVSYVPMSNLADDLPPEEPDIGTLEDSHPAKHDEMEIMEGTPHTPDTLLIREASAVVWTALFGACYSL